MQFVMIPTNYTGTIYIDDLQMFKKGVEVDDLLEEYPHEDGFVYENPSEGDSDGEDKKGCGSALYGGVFGSIVALVACAFSTVLLLRKNI